ncbi:MAG: peptidoglycan-binding protein [Pseudomonadota bacterium]
MEKHVFDRRSARTLGQHRFARRPERRLALGVLALGASVLAAAPAAAEYDLGLEAFRRGEQELALDLWERYAVAGDVRSMKALGDFYSSQTIVNTNGAEIEAEKRTRADYVLALKWYLLAANHVFNEEYKKPSVYERNAQIEADERLPDIRSKMTDAEVKRAEKLVTDTFERGRPRDIFLVAQMFQRGAGVAKSNVRAYELYTVASARGVDEATRALQDMRVGGLVNERQIKAAEDAAAIWQPPLPEEHTGDTLQMAELKRLKSELEALRLQKALESVSDIDVSVLQHSLRALGYYFGGIDNKMGPQTREAIRRFQYAQVRDDREMTAEEKRNVEIGVLSAEDTVELISQAARRADNEIAQYTYGVMYLQGIGVEQDGSQAVDWLKKAANRNVAEAHYALGVVYRDGTTGLNAVARSKANAALHFAKAGQLGYAPARKALELLEFERPRRAGE